jgi:uncharacterized membrane protein YoaK (UPF0700 family)
MTRYDRRSWFLAAGLAATAGYVDAIGFLRLGGFFVSFMSGNSTRFAVGVVTDARVARTAGALIAGFALGVVMGTWLSIRHGGGRTPTSLLLMAALLTVAAVSEGWVPAMATSLMMAAAMGAANTLFQRDGEVSVGVTYMTGTLVKCVQRLTAALMGSGPRWAWLPYALLWMGLVAGACGGAAVYGAVGTAGMWLAVAAVALLAVYARAIGRPHAP